jgi:hypothetical protein
MKGEREGPLEEAMRRLKGMGRGTIDQYGKEGG